MLVRSLWAGIIGIEEKKLYSQSIILMAIFLRKTLWDRKKHDNTINSIHRMGFQRDEKMVVLGVLLVPDKSRLDLVTYLEGPMHAIVRYFCSD